MSLPLTYPFAVGNGKITHLTIRYTRKGDKIATANTGYIYWRRRNAPRNIQFRHPAVNDWNQLLCGGIAITPLTNEELPEVAAVLRGAKPVGVAHSRDKELLAAKLEECTKAGFQATIHESEHQPGKLWFLTVSPSGTIGDFFPSLDVLAADYEKHGLKWCADDIRQYKTRPFSDFHGDRYDVEHHPIAVVGLILGYPIEDTISIVKYPCSPEKPPRKLVPKQIYKKIRQVDNKVLKLLEQEMATFTFRDTDDRYYAIGSVELEDDQYTLTLAVQDGKKVPANTRTRTDSKIPHPLEDILYVYSERMMIYDPTSNKCHDRPVAEYVDGGVEFWSEEQ